MQEEEKELIRNIDIDRDINNNIRLAPILRRLNDMGFPVKDTVVSYRSHIENAFIYVGKEPLTEDTCVSFNDLEPPNHRLVLRCR